MSRAADPDARSTDDPLSELASLFLTDEDGGDTPRETHERTAPIELALVGHLPVMGGLWLTQYADQIARRGGATALIRLERGQTTVELLRAPGPRGGLESAETLDEALHILAERAERWIVCPQSESTLEGPFPGDALTLLTGGDDAATVAAYRIVKSLAERWHAAQWPLPAIGLVVLGAPSDRVGEIAEKLDRTTKAFLDVDLRVAGQYQRMDAIESAGRRTFAGEAPSVAELCRRIEAAERRVRRVEPRREAPSAPRPRPGFRLAPKPSAARSVEPKPMPAPPERSAAMDLPPGCAALAARCPAAPEVRLAIDVAGALHLVVDLPALSRLPEVEAWALAHWEILRLVESRLSAGRPARLAVDVVTTDAPSVARLHGVGFALHLFVATPAGPVHVALNDAAAVR